MSKSGQVVYDSRQIALNYIRGWFLLDLLAAIPFDLLYAFQVDTVIYQLYAHSDSDAISFHIYASQAWNWVIGSPGQWVIWVIFHVRVTGSPGHHFDPV